jgi:outer membrane murein-binding lipoprotein Lpp
MLGLVTTETKVMTRYGEEAWVGVQVSPDIAGHEWCSRNPTFVAESIDAIARPFTEAAERSVPLSKTGDGQSGLRTERVTLEFEVERGSPPSEWPWSYILSRSDALKMRPGESVRVVDETHFDDLAQVAMERDAAIRERDALRASAITQSLTADRFAAAVSEADTLRARVDELEAERDNRATIDEVAHQRDTLQSRVNRLEKTLAGEKVNVAELEADVIGLRGDVKAAEREAERLSEQLESVACRAATAETALEARNVTAGEGSCAAQAASGGGDQPRAWLTEDEREIIAGIADDDEYTEEGQNIAKGLLARSSPPEVVLESWREAAGEVVSLEDVRAVLSAIGVAVKEVPRD